MEKEQENMTLPVIQRYSTTEMAPFFDVCPRQVRRELEKVKHKYGPRRGQKWSPKQVKMIFDDFNIHHQPLDYQTALMFGITAKNNLYESAA